jgi:hypothetical protein
MFILQLVTTAVEVEPEISKLLAKSRYRTLFASHIRKIIRVLFSHVILIDIYINFPSTVTYAFLSPSPLEPPVFHYVKNVRSPVVFVQYHKFTKCL